MSSATSSDPGPFARLGPAGDLLARIVAGDRVAPAYLFDGADAEGPREAARLFAAALVCRAPRRPCLACPACRRAASGNHPDVHRQGRDKATVISVEALGALLERAHASPMEAARQVFVVDPAEAMAPEAMARYLKTLEEPPPSTTFVLVTTRPDRLPDTVRSRCQRLRFPSPSEEDVAAGLAGAGLAPARAARLARWAGGSPTRAARLAAIEADLAVDAILAAGAGPAPSAATTAEAVVAALRRRGALPEDGEGAGEGGSGEPATTPAEVLRRGLEDLLHALAVVVRDRVAGVPGGPLEDLPAERAAIALERLARLGVYVRRNVAPSALVIEAVAALRRPGGS